MNFKEILQELTPFIVLAPIFILFALYAVFNIWRANDISVMLLPQALAILVVGVLCLILDRWAIRNWSQQVLVFVELLVIGGAYFGAAYQSRVLILEVKESVEYFQVISPIRGEKETPSVCVFPFSRKIVIDENEAIVFLSKVLLEKYLLEVKPKRDYLVSGQTYTIEGKVYEVSQYRFDGLEGEPMEVGWVEELLEKNQ